MQRRRAWLFFLACSLSACGLGATLYLTLVHVRAAAAYRASATYGSQAATSHEPDQEPGQNVRVKADPGSTAVDPEVIGRLEIPKLGLSVPILKNYESRDLLRGVGHIPGTANLGGLGNAGVAGHRDTYFRPLRNIARAMEIKVDSSEGVYHYQVDSTEIVKPSQVEVLDTHSQPELTLITCYPFNYIGAAPMRFIIHAHLLSIVPDPK